MSCSVSGGLLPPVPDLIPISSAMGEQRSRRLVTGKQQSDNNSCCKSPCSSTAAAAAGTLIDNKSRGVCGANALLAAARKADSEHRQRHRKLDRRREHTHLRKHNNNNNNNNNSNSGYGSSGDCDNNSGEDNPRSETSSSSGAPPVNPRVNPIFVWVKQENSRIVDVKCEDYDKRNRILLTKTAQGWRAIPRTETATAKRRPDDDNSPRSKNAAKVHKGHRRSSKVKRKSTAVQVDRDLQDLEQQPETTTTTHAPAENLPPQDWSDPVNIESHLPSHTILVSSRLNAAAAVVTTTSCAQPTCTPTTSSATTNDHDGGGCAESTLCDQVNRCHNTLLTIECPVPKICEPSPLDNLLAVAELEFNQQFNQGRHSDDEDDEEEADHHPDQDDVVDDKIVDDYDENMEHLTSFINSCTAAAEAAAQKQQQETSSQVQDIPTEQELLKEPSDCDYRDDEDDNTLAMDDILSRLEQSLRSPDAIHATDMHDILTNGDELDAASAQGAKRDVSRTPEHSAATIVEQEELETEQDDDVIERKLEEAMDAAEPEQEEQLTQLSDDCPNELVCEAFTEDDLGKSCDIDKVDFEQTATATNDETDLMVETPIQNEEAIVSSTPDFPTDLSKKKLDDCTPTDLSVPKNKTRHSPPPRPQSQSSETMQSPQPSGIPAVPPSPDIVQTAGKVRSAFLETMLSAQSAKPVSATIIDNIAKEPLNLGKNREAASPTVTCSEEVKSRHLSEDEPVYKKFKMEDITIKTLLDAETERNKARKASEEKANVETPKLLELLTNDADILSPVTQLKQLLSSDKIKIPDPMLIPKDRLSLVLTNPLKEVPRLLTQRPELRLPEVLDYPELLQDPNMLVVTLEQLKNIIYKQSSIPEENRKSPLKQRSSNADKKATIEAKHLPQQQQNHPSDVASGKLQQSFSKGTNKEREREPAPRNGEKTHNQDDTSIANDLNAATNAMLNQMMWLPYLNQLESMNYGVNNNTNNMEFLKILRTIMPPYPMMPSDTVSQMLATHRFPGQHFPMPNFNPEIAMWQEAMLQASLLRQRSPYELFNGNKESREFSGNKASTPTASQQAPSSRHQSTKAKQSTSSSSASSYAPAAAVVAKSNSYTSAYNQQVTNARTLSNSLNHHHQPSSQKTSSSSNQQHQQSTSNRNQSNQRHQQPTTSYNGHTFMDPVSHYLSSTKDAYHKDQYNLQKDYLSKDNYLLQKQHQLQIQQQQQMNEAMSQYMKQQQQQQSQLQQQQQQQSSRSSASGRDVVRDRDSVRDAASSLGGGGYKSVSCKSFASLISGEQHSGSASQMATSGSSGSSRKDNGGGSNKQYSAPIDLSNITPHSSTHQTTSLSAAAALSTLSSTHNSINNPYNSHHHQQTVPTTTSASASLLTHYQTSTTASAAATMGKIKVKQHLVDPNLQPPKLLKRLSEAEHEVGSTTDMDMQDMAAQNTHLWHPLFGNQKSYSSPCNWTTVTATGE